MSGGRYTFTSSLWEHHGKGRWHFADLPEDIADEIDAVYGQRSGGFGAVRVHVTIGGTTCCLYPAECVVDVCDRPFLVVLVFVGGRISVVGSLCR